MSVIPLRKTLGMSQNDFSKLVGTTALTISKWEGAEDEPFEPAGSAKFIMLGIEMALKSSGNSPDMINYIVMNSRIGGISFLLMRLLEQVNLGK